MEQWFSRSRSTAGAALLLLTLTGCPKTEFGPIQTPDAGEQSDAGTQPDAGAQSDWTPVQSAIPKDTALEAKVDALVAGMSLEEKVGQMLQVEIPSVTADEVKQYHIGAVLNGGGSWPNGKKSSTPDEWNARADELWTASMDPSNPHQIPIMWGTDAVHGHNNVKGATLFPHNIGLGAANDPDLIRRIGEVTAREVTHTGIDWAFGPTLAVVRDDRWGRTYEGYSEDPAIVEAYAGKMIEGLQGQLAKDAKTNEKVIATAKHFLGDGATTNGKDQGISEVTEQQLRDLHSRGYVSALGAGAQTVMASYSSWKDAAQGPNAKAYKMHGNKYLLTDVLKTKMGFDGFIISDWNGIGQITTSNSDSPRDCSNSDCPQAINAGVDMAMVPARADWKPFITNTIASVNKGEISIDRVNDAVRRILRVKFRAGLFDKPRPSARNSSHDIGTPENRAVAREAVRKSLVLLKNNDKTLPLSRAAKVLVVGAGADSLSNQSGGWSLTWQGTNNTNADFGGGTTLWAAVKAIAPNATLDTSIDGSAANSSYDAAVVVIGETPYAEGQGDIGKSGTLELSFLHPEGLSLLAKLKASGVKKIVTVLYSGRPFYVNKELNQSDAFVAAFLPGTEGDGMADVLFAKADGSVNYDFQGRLSYSWPKSPCQVPLNKGDANYDPLFAYGYGLTYAQPQAVAALAEPTQNVGCNEDSGGGGTATSALSLFDSGINQGNWVMRLGGPSDGYSGTDVALASATTTQLPANEVNATPVDYAGRQWAGIHAVWSGTGQLYIQNKQGNDTKDLRPYYNANGALVFVTKVDKGPASQVNLSLHCVYPCRGEIQVTQTLRDLEGKGWTELAVPLSCFKAPGSTMDFSLVNTPFLLYTEGAMDLSLANIRWEPNRAGNVNCKEMAPPPQNTIVPLTDDKDVYMNGAYDDSIFAKPTSWNAGSPGTVTLDAAFDIGGGEKVIDVQMSGYTKAHADGSGGSNGGIALSTKAMTLLDASAIASAGGVEFEVRVLDYGETTKPFWVKMVCKHDAGSCATGDLDKPLGRPALNTWTKVTIPFTDAGYPASWDKAQISSAMEMLPAWGDQAGTIHFQVRNVRIKKQL